MNDATLMAGTARVEITPDPAMLNWVDMKPYDGVVDALCVRVLVLGDGQTCAALVCWDLIDVVAETATAVQKAILATTGIPESHVMLAASHTHSGPRSPFTEASVAPGRLERLRPLLDDAVFRTWGAKLPGVCADLAKQAQAAAVPVTCAIGRAYAGEWLFNRRPLDAAGNAVTMFVPEDAHCLPDGLRFGVVDPTLTALSMRGGDGQAVATVFSVPCHSVAVYPHHRGISADWPGPACAHLAADLGGEAFFLQGCAGDIVPARRGLDARNEMARFFADRALGAISRGHGLPGAPLRVMSQVVHLPLLPEAREKMGVDALPADIQVMLLGAFALVALPGEPLNGLAREIQARSPFPHTLVVGYANGRGAGYVGLPGEKARGGYEARAGSGTEEAGLFMIETAVRMLCELRG